MFHTLAIWDESCRLRTVSKPLKSHKKREPQPNALSLRQDAHENQNPRKSLASYLSLHALKLSRLQNETQSECFKILKKDRKSGIMFYMFRKCLQIY